MYSSPASAPSAHVAVKVVLTATALLLGGSLPLASADGWQEGRASFYGNDGGATIHQGSCMFYELDKDAGTGWDIAALSDHNYDFDGSCGRCYEVQCRPAVFTDGYGQSLDRSGSVCHDPDKSVIVRVTDACPCFYPNNAFSNKRWCCGDMQHIDLSYVAFSKLSDEKWGVIGARWRRVECPPGTPANTPLQEQRNRAWGGY